MSNAEAREWFRAQQETLRAELQGVRRIQSHPTAKGDGSELKWLKMLQNRLPHRYRAEKAFVIDANGDRSEQIDIVIHDRQFCPLLLDTEGGVHVPAESVYVAIEVKQDLTKDNVMYAGEKIASVRRLFRTSAEFQVGQRRERTEPKRILGGIVAYESGWSPSFGGAFIDVIEGLKEGERVDVGCALCDGGFDVTYREGTGEPALRRSGPESSLIFFFFELLHRLQQVGTVPGMEYQRYTGLLVEGLAPVERARLRRRK